MASGWNQSGFLNGNINTTLDPYYLCFLDENTPTVTRTNGLTTIDLTADLSAHLISGLETPCMLPRPAMVASRRGGSFLNGQRRDIPLSEPYVKGMIGFIARNACRSQGLFGSCGAGYANLDCNGRRISERPRRKFGLTWDRQTPLGL